MRAFFIIAAASVTALLTVAAPAQAQANRTFVSGHGTDSNNCSLNAPCRSFAQALLQTNAGGEITVLDPAGFGPVTITKAISIINDGVGEAGITAASTEDAITITAGASDVINLRGLTLVGSVGSITNNGITFHTGGALNVQNCVIRGFGGGLTLFPASSSSFNVSDTIVSNNSGTGIELGPNGANQTVTAFFERVQSIGNSSGFIIQGNFGTGTLQVMAADSAATGNAVHGFFAGSQANALVTTFTIVNSKAIGNGSGVATLGSGNVTMFLAQTTISGNGNGFSTTLPPIKTFGNNNIADTTNTGTLTAITQQ